MPAEKPAETCRIFLFGESAAMGDPAPAFGFARASSRCLLRAQYPGKHFQVVNVAVTAINSHVIRQIARDCAPLQGDVWVLYIGNNEVVGPFGAGTIFGSQTPPRAAVRGQIALKATRLGQGLDALKWRLTRSSATPAVWEGMEMFLKQQIRQDDSRMARVYDHFRKNLEDIVRLGLEAGGRLLVSTVVGNLKDCPPSASLHRPGLSAKQLAEWENLYEAAPAQPWSRPPITRRPSRPINKLRPSTIATLNCGSVWLAVIGPWAATRGQPQFRTGTGLGYAAFPRRHASQPNHPRSGREPCGAGRQWLEAREVFAQNSPHGIVGDELLYEHSTLISGATICWPAPWPNKSLLCCQEHLRMETPLATPVGS